LWKHSWRPELSSKRMGRALSKDLKEAGDKSTHMCEKDLVSDRTEISWLPCHHLAVFPHINWRPIHLSGFASRLGSSTECTFSVCRLVFMGLSPAALEQVRSGRSLYRSAGDWLLIIHFDGEAEVFDHAPDFGSWCAWSCEVPVHKDGVGRVEGKGL
jgi:hypothetical protein